MDKAIIRLANMPLPEWADRSNIKNICRCCGKNLGLERFMDDAPIHTRCIPKHWGKHSHNVNASRCQEFGR
jgi:hypothetical protein